MTQSDMQNVVPIIFIMMHAEAKNPRKKQRLDLQKPVPQTTFRIGTWKAPKRMPEIWQSQARFRQMF